MRPSAFHLRLKSFLLFLLLVLISFSSGAEESTRFTPQDNDVSISVLKGIIGDWSGGSNDLTPLLGGAMSVFLAGVLVFATAIFAYTAIVGTLQSAHDGQLLGKQWSTVWVPIRFSMGIALLVPTGSGLCMAQHGMLWLLSNGVGFASYVTEKSAASYLDRMGQAVSVKAANGAMIQNVTLAILGNELCVAALNKEFSDGSGEPKKFGVSVMDSGGNVTAVGSGSGYFGPSRSPVGSTIQWGALPGTNTGKSDNVCGQTIAINQSWGGFFDNELDKLSRYGQANGTLSLAEGLRPIAEKAMSYGGEGMAFVTKEEVAQAIKTAAINYQNELAAMVGGSIDRETEEWTKSVKDTARENGWFTMGTWYFQLNRLNSKLNDYANNIMTVDMFDERSVANDAATLYGLNENDKHTIREVRNMAANYFSRQPIPTNKLITESGISAGGSMSTNPIGSVVDNLSNSVFGVGDSTSSSDWALSFGYNPENNSPAIVQLKNLGDTFLNVAWGGVAIAGAGVASDLMPAKKIGGSLIDAIKGLGSKDKNEESSVVKGFFGSLVSSLMMMFFVIGIILAFWLPMLPFINWVGGIVGWVISVLEMLVATPIWLAAHLHPEGEGMASRYAASGYMIIIELLLRPVLMVFGFIVAVIIVDPLLNVISWMYFPAFASSTSDAIGGPLTLIMKIVIYVVICWMVVNFAFKAISTVPSGVMKWIGGMPGQNTDMAEGLGENSRMAVVAGVHQVQGAGRVAGASAREARKNIQEIRQRKSGQGKNMQPGRDGS